MARKITRSPGRGKKVDTFTYDVVTPAGDKKRSVEIDVYMSKSLAGDEPPLEVTGVTFSLICEEAAEEITGSDLQIALLAMRSRLDARYAIRWERWLKVEVNPQRHHRGDGSGLSLSYEEVWRGIDPFGAVLMREFSPYSEKQWIISAWPEAFKDKRGRTLACVPATDANVAALEDFSRRIVNLRSVLAEFVSPDRIEETLGAIAAGAMTLLPPPRGA